MFYWNENKRRLKLKGTQGTQGTLFLILHFSFSFVFKNSKLI